MHADTYILKTGEIGAQRLYMQHEVYGPSSEEFLRRAGVRRGLHVADIGCGPGIMTAWLTRQVGATGSVVGVDTSKEQLAVARAAFEQAALVNVALVEASAYDTQLPRAAFDLVHCRFLLDHLTDAAAALNEMKELVKPGGVVACEELDFTGMGSDPPEVAYRREVIFMRGLAAKTGVSGKGLSLHRLFRDVGLSVEEVTLFQPAFVRGPGKRLWEYAVAEFAPALIEAGHYTRAELDARIEGLRRANSDDRTLALLPRKVQVWGRRST